MLALATAPKLSLVQSLRMVAGTMPAGDGRRELPPVRSRARA